MAGRGDLDVEVRAVDCLVKLDRLLERANRIELVGDSMRRSDTPAKTRDKRVTTP